ncbi:MAG: hypothetical protein J7L07_11330 [Candidatus Odinarchaeota archaeon]|nr:hypothetical protein [Candidatus Odinarchaeota archaeon]
MLVYWVNLFIRYDVSIVSAFLICILMGLVYGFIFAMSAFISRFKDTVYIFQCILAYAASLAILNYYLLFIRGIVQMNLVDLVFFNFIPWLIIVISMRFYKPGENLKSTKGIIKYTMRFIGWCFIFLFFPMILVFSVTCALDSLLLIMKFLKGAL